MLAVANTTFSRIDAKAVPACSDAWKARVKQGCKAQADISGTYRLHSLKLPEPRCSRQDRLFSVTVSQYQKQGCQSGLHANTHLPPAFGFHMSGLADKG